jgi:serpin B
MTFRAYPLLSVVLVFGCGADSGPTAPPPLLTSLPRELTSDEIAIQTAINDLSFRLLGQLSRADPTGNIFVSPLSVSSALGMAANGASGDTYNQIRQTLGLNGMQEQAINQGYKGLVDLLLSLDASVDVQIANSLWHHQLYSVQPTFANALNSYFGATPFARDFRNPATVTEINGWVNTRTFGKIPSIIEQISDQEIMFLINAIFFHGKWREPFDPAKSQVGTFTTGDARQLATTFMAREGQQLTFSQSQMFTSARLPYGNGAFAMALLRPNAPLDVFTDMLTVALWNEIQAGFGTGRAVLRVPRFTLEYKRSLADDLKALGMVRPFDSDAAEFPRMVLGSDQLFISRVEHRAAVDVNEAGTTAAAATSVGVGVTSAPPQLDFDRPFVFVIYEQFSGTILFLGSFREPPQP